MAALWTLVGLVSGAQASLAATLQGRPEPLGAALVDGLFQFLPWIPATLVAVGLAGRFPLDARVLAASPLDPSARRPRHCLPHEPDRGPRVLGALGPVPRPRHPRDQAGFWGLVRLHFAALFYAAAVAAALGLRSWRDLRRREVELAQLSAQLSEARLQALNAQIRPHFLFNTLHAIGQLWRSGRAREADAMLDHLGALFQKVIASTAAHPGAARGGAGDGARLPGDRGGALRRRACEPRRRARGRRSAAWCRRSCCSRSSRTRSSTGCRRRPRAGRCGSSRGSKARGCC